MMRFQYHSHNHGHTGRGSKGSSCYPCFPISFGTVLIRDRKWGKNREKWEKMWGKWAKMEEKIGKGCYPYENVALFLDFYL